MFSSCVSSFNEVSLSSSSSSTASFSTEFQLWRCKEFRGSVRCAEKVVQGVGAVVRFVNRDGDVLALEGSSNGGGKSTESSYVDCWSCG